MVAAEHIIALVERYGQAMRDAGAAHRSGDNRAATEATTRAEALMDSIRDALGCPEGH